MNRLTSLSLAALLLAGISGVAACSSSDVNEPGPNGSAGGENDAGDDPDSGDEIDGKRLVILFTSDEHSHLFAFGPELDDWPLATEAGSGALVGGVARRATVLARERKAAQDAGKATLTLSAGDNNMGALSHIAFESSSIDYRLLHGLGYQATTLGNHEFDLGPKALANAIKAAKDANELPPIIATNIYFDDEDPADDDLAALVGEGDDKPIQRYRVLEADNGIKVGLIGYMGVNASHVATTKGPVRFSERDVDEADKSNQDVVLPKLYEDLQPVVDKLRNDEKVDIVIALSHAGVLDTKNPETSEDWAIAANVSGIDLIISGHEHSDDATPIVVKNTTSGRDVVIVNGSSYGRHVGRIELILPEDGSTPVTFDAATQALLPITDKEIPDASYGPILESALGAIETADQVDGQSWLARLLSRVTGGPVDYQEKGDFYFYPVAKTTFDLPKDHSMLFLTADAMLAAAKDVAPAQIAIQSNGVVRSGLFKGKTGNVSAADAFAALPLGSSPKDGSLGYPLVRAHLPAFFLRAIFEFASTRGPVNSQFDLASGGLLVEYDCSREPVQTQTDLLNAKKGRVMRMLLDTDPSDGFEQFDRVIYDRNDPTKDAPNNELFAVVTSSYIAEFAGDVGAPIQDENGEARTIPEIVLHREDESEVKEIEAFMSYLHALPESTIPDRYDASSANATQRFEKMKLCK